MAALDGGMTRFKFVWWHVTKSLLVFPTGVSCVNIKVSMKD